MLELLGSDQNRPPPDIQKKPDRQVQMILHFNINFDNSKGRDFRTILASQPFLSNLYKKIIMLLFIKIANMAAVVNRNASRIRVLTARSSEDKHLLTSWRLKFVIP